ncbi:MAG: sugar phosphate nucleotidyltransferase, partial [Myxococcota bacterium]
SGARILLKQVPDPQRFGVIEFEGEVGASPIKQIIEKPSDPPSDYAVTGIYFYDATVFDIAKEQRPSDRGELEITDVNNAYLERGNLKYNLLDGWWTDAGTIESLHRASNLVAEGGANNVQDGAS